MVYKLDQPFGVYEYIVITKKTAKQYQCQFLMSTPRDGATKYFVDNNGTIEYYYTYNEEIENKTRLIRLKLNGNWYLKQWEVCPAIVGCGAAQYRENQINSILED